MRMYRLLIVDDEPHVVDAMIALLEVQSDLLMDICYAYGGKEAVEISKQGKIDLLITDIQMPDMSGIELVDAVTKLWPFCRTVFLTAFSDFNYAYEAIQRHAASYILKTEDDEYILKEIRSALTAIDNELNQQQLLAEVAQSASKKTDCVRRNLFFYLLGHEPAREDMKPYYRILGFQSAESPLYLLLGQIDKNAADNTSDAFSRAPAVIVNSIMDHYMGEHLLDIVGEQEESSGRMIWLLQVKNQEEVTQCDFYFAQQWLSGILETVQSSCRETAGVKISYLVSAPISDFNHINEVYHLMISQSARLEVNPDPFVYTCANRPDSQAVSLERDLSANTIRFIKEYIDVHITEDLSLMRLSTVTGYNDTYLSNIFHKQTGEYLYKYIAAKKLKHIENLFRDTSLSIEAICQLAGFASRPYFNRFIKKETGMTPKGYQMKIRNGT